MVDQGSSIWTEERKRVLNGLEELPDPILSQLYEKAINLASDYYPESSEAQFNLAIIGHCVRELMNNISYYLDGVSTSGRNRSGAEDRTAKELRELLVSEYPDIALTPSKNATQVPVPANLAVALSAYRSMAIEGRIKYVEIEITEKGYHEFRHVHAIGASRMNGSSAGVECRNLNQKSII